MFDLKLRKKTPFASVLFNIDRKDIDLDKYKDNLDIQDIGPDDRIEFFNIIKSWDFERCSVYDPNNTYDQYVDLFTSGITNGKVTRHPISSLLYTTNIDNTMYDKKAADINQLVAILAIPLKGILAPIKKSSDYKLYNASFIPCKTFKWNDDVYNKLVYLMVDISTYFSFQEYVKCEDSNENNDRYSMINHVFHYDGNSIIEKHFVSIVPHRDREHLFIPNPSKNLFSLSDIPEDVIIKGNSISVELKSE